MNEDTKGPQSPDVGARVGCGAGNGRDKAARGPAIRFAAVFLCITFALLITFRLGIGSPAMNWYLFQVARHTGALLTLLGDSCEVETPSGYLGREAEVRSALSVRRRVEIKPDSNGASSEAATPLTSWEVWQYRMGKLQGEIAAHREAWSSLTPPTPAQVFNREEHVALLRTRLAELKGFVPDSGHAERARMAKAGLRQFVKTCDEELDALEESSQVDTATFVARMAALEGDIETWRLGQHTFVQGRLDNLQAQLRKRGPRVDFCYRETAKNPESATSASRDVRFSFEVVPDCGALPSMAIYLAAVFAFPTLWRRRLLGALLGVFILYGVNVARLACLAVIGAWDSGGEWFTFCHEYVWQGIYVVCVVVTWLLWLELIVKRNPGEDAP